MKGEIVPLMSINYTVKYAETFLSFVGAKTNRLVHQTRQQHSQEQALFFLLFAIALFPSFILLPFLVADSCQVQK